MSDTPPIGMAFWLLKGTLPDRVQWLTENNFTGLSLLQGIMDADRGECEEAAALIREADMNVTYHGNVHHRLLDNHALDTEFIERMLDNVLWWHAHTRGVASVCFDPLHADGPDKKKHFLWDQSQALIEIMSDRLRPAGIRTGIENGFGGGASFCSLPDFKQLLDRTAGHAPGMLLDLAHANVHTRSDDTAGENDMAAYLEAIPLDILEVHVSDNKGVRDEHRHAGYGNLDLGAALKALKARGFTAQITVEVCVDILAGHYGADLNKPEELEPILQTRQAIADAWEEGIAQR